MLVLEWKERAFIEKVNSRCFCWFPAAILVHQNGAPIWRLHTKLYKSAWNVSANNSDAVGHKDLRLGNIVYILVSYNISFSWLLPLAVSNSLFFCAVFIAWLRENDLLLNCENSRNARHRKTNASIGWLQTRHISLVWKTILFLKLTVYLLIR